MSDEPRATGRGGRREGSGRKPVDPRGPGRVTTIKLVEEDIAYLDAIGGGNVSEGVRQLVKRARANSL